MKSLRGFCTMFAVGVVGCSVPMIGRGQTAVAPSAASAAADSLAVAPPVVQVRDFWRSSVVSVLAWDVDDAGFGLRTEVSRNGTLVGGRRFGDHRLYIAPEVVWHMGGMMQAFSEAGKPLMPTGWRSDPYACFYGIHCSPMTSIGVRIPDALLRANRDSLVVTFLPRVQDPWTITLRRELLATYLAKVDSVVAEMKKTGAR